MHAWQGKRTLESAYKRRAKESNAVSYKPLQQQDGAEDEGAGTEMVGSEATPVKDGSDDKDGSVPVDERALAAEVARESARPWGALLSLASTSNRCAWADYTYGNATQRLQKTTRHCEAREAVFQFSSRRTIGPSEDATYVVPQLAEGAVEEATERVVTDHIRCILHACIELEPLTRV